jgi:hypothetical protein
MRHWIRCLLALALGLLCALLVSCGSSGRGLISLAAAGPLRGDFEAIARAARTGNGSCGATSKAIENAQLDLEKLPSTVDQGLRTRLSEGLTNLRKLALEECEQPVAEATQTNTQSTTTTTTQSTQTTTTATQSTPTVTTTTQSTPTTTTSTQTTPPPGGGTQAPGESAPGSGEQTPPTPGASPNPENGSSGGTGQGSEQ